MASVTLVNSATTFPAFTPPATAAILFPAGAAADKDVKPSKEFAPAAPDQILVSINSATSADACAIKKSENLGGKLSNAEYPI